MNEREPHTRIFSADDLDEKLARARARNEANSVVETAQLEAAENEKKAQRDLIRRRSLMQSAAQREISKEMEETRRKAATLAVTEVLYSSASVHRKFDRLTPWIEDLVETCLRRIIGEVPNEEILKRIVTQAISQSRKELKYILRAGTEVFVPALKLVEDLETTSYRGLILSVEVDHDLSSGSVVLTSSDGALDISLETQLAAVRKELTSVLEA